LPTLRLQNSDGGEGRFEHVTVAPPFTSFVPRTAVARARSVSSLARTKACGMPGGRFAGGLPRHLLTRPFRSTVANEAYETLHPVVLDAQELCAHHVPGRLDLASLHGASRCAVRIPLSLHIIVCRPRPFLCTPDCGYRARRRMPLSIRARRFFSSLEPISHSHIACT